MDEINGSRGLWRNLEVKGHTPFVLRGRWEKDGHKPLDEYLFVVPGDGLNGRLDRIAGWGPNHLLIRPGSSSAVQFIGDGSERFLGELSFGNVEQLWTQARNGLDEGWQARFLDKAWISYCVANT
jgi:hypothetical protein